MVVTILEGLVIVKERLEPRDLYPLYKWANSDSLSECILASESIINGRYVYYTGIIRLSVKNLVLLCPRLSMLDPVVFEVADGKESTMGVFLDNKYKQYGIFRDVSLLRKYVASKLELGALRVALGEGATQEHYKQIATLIEDGRGLFNSRLYII